jgi:hypothetical protein
MNRASGVAVGALTVIALSAAAFGALSFADHSEAVDRTPTTQLPFVTSVSTTPPTSAAPSPTTSSTAAVAPAPANVTPVGPCDSSTVEQLGYRNMTGNTPDAVNQIGQSERGRPIMAEHWGRATGPQVLVVGQIHGNECAPAWFVEEIRKNPPSEYGIWLIPTLNPDGLEDGTRNNALGVDLNRDGFSQKAAETRALLQFTSELQPVLSMHIHAPYSWVGSFNGGTASRVASRMAKEAFNSRAMNAGTNSKTEGWFLWQGQDQVLPGHQSVLVEFPAVSELDTPNPPNPSQRVVKDVETVRRSAQLLLQALAGVMRTLS